MTHAAHCMATGQVQLPPRLLPTQLTDAQVDSALLCCPPLLFPSLQKYGGGQPFPAEEDGGANELALCTLCIQAMLAMLHK